jgi:DNA repair exonuclease SbcCD ATPase subunit
MKRGLDRQVKNPGVLAGVKSKIQDASQRYDAAKDEVSKAEAKKIELLEVGRQLTNVKEQYENAKVLLEKNKQRKEIEASIEKLTKDYGSLEELLNRIKSLKEDSDKADKALRVIEGFSDKQRVAEFRKGLDSIQNRRGIIEKDLAQREKELLEAKEKLDKRKSFRFLSSGKGITAAIIMLAGGIIGVIVGPFYLLSLIILGAALLAVTIRARTALIRDKTTISGVEERIQRMTESLGEVSQEERQLLAEAKCNTVAEFNQKERDFDDWLEEKRRAEARLEGILSGRTIEDIEKQRPGIAKALAVEEARLTDDLKQTSLSPEGYVELERKVQNLGKRQADLEDQKRRCEILIEQVRFNIEDQVKLEEELESLRKALGREERKVRVYELVREFISRARSEVLWSVEEALEKEIQKYLAVFTNRKYKQVKVDKEGLEFWIYSDEKGGLARPEDLSGGVIDEFYLAFRVALARLIFGDKKPPLILDDPFVNFDSVRLDNTLNFFKTLAADYQIIIFTLSDLYDEVADNIILLGEKGKLL